MSSHKGSLSRFALALVIVLGLAAPLLYRAVEQCTPSDAPLTHRLIIYELVFACLALTVALVTTRMIPGTSPTPFSIGSLRVSVSPVRVLALGTKPGVTWGAELLPLTLVITGVTALFVYGTSGLSPDWSVIANAAGWIALLAALNAAAEEWLYRIALLRVSEGRMNLNGASLLSAVVFGLAHLGGTPGGLSGALAAAFLGFILCRLTRESGGLAAAWGVHFLQDLLIFSALFMESPVAVST